MDKEDAARKIIAASLQHVPFDGWTMRSLMRGAQDAGFARTDVIRVFPYGAMQAVDYFFAESDKAMVEALQGYNLDTMKIRARITLAVKLRIEVHANHKEAVARAVSLYSLPFHMPRGMHALYRTVDTIWHAIGDTSTDFNFYTKRATLAAVYVSTFNTWLGDDTPGNQATWDFLDRRIENVMQVEKLKAKVRNLTNF